MCGSMCMALDATNDAAGILERCCGYARNVTAPPVHLWRPRSLSGTLAMRGTTSHYAIDPRAEYVFGVVERGAMRARRGRERHRAGPGSVVAWDPSGPHEGEGVGGPWRARLLILEAGDLRRLAADDEGGPLLGQEFPHP